MLNKENQLNLRFQMRIIITIFFVCIQALAKAAYVPGTPGGRWTDEELIITKGKINWIIDNGVQALELVPGGTQAVKQYKDMRKPVNVLDSILPNVGKLVRLSFHDCIPEEGGGGCNGCLNMDGVGNRYSFADCSVRRTCRSAAGGIHPQRGPFKTDNNNLYWAALVLEHLYKNARFGPTNHKQHLRSSLHETGKSRADLWAFAGLVALQKAADNNNRMCTKSHYACARLINGNYVDCDYEYPYTQFSYGRADCKSSCPPDVPFCSNAKEIHPNPHGNGDETVDYFKKQFGLSAKETIALMGAHTLGHPTETVSMFRHYTWAPGGKDRLDNDYFVQMVNTTNYKLVGMGKKDSSGGCTQSRFLGDEYGNPFNVYHFVRSERKTDTFGPFNWNLHGRECNYQVCKSVKASTGSYSPNSCCAELERCMKAGNCRDFKGCKRSDPQCKYANNFFSSNMLSSDIGLYRKFQTDGDGRPRGCSSLDKSAGWHANRLRYSRPSNCPRNDQPIEDGETMASMTEKYAHSNSGVWVQDFVKVFAKMQTSGYGSGGLNLNPTSGQWFRARNKRGYWSVGKH